jgi:hypothetical protein
MLSGWAYPDGMTDHVTDESWDFVVPPEGPEALVAEFHRRGIGPGQRLHVTLISDSHDSTADRQGDSDFDERARQFMPGFTGSFDSGDPDFAERSEEILKEIIAKQ